MMCKLAFRNVKRMAKDYIVYFMTMAVVTALMFSFHTLLFSKDVQNLFQMDAMMGVMTGLATASNFYARQIARCMAIWRKILSTDKKDRIKFAVHRHLCDITDK